MGLTKKSLYTLSVVFVAIQSILYPIILFASGDIVNITQFIAITVSFIYSLIILYNDKKSYLTSLALFFTVIADLFLVLLNCFAPFDSLQTVAMAVFSFAHICYFLRLFFSEVDLKRRKAHLLVRVLVVIAGIFISLAVTGFKVDWLLTITVFYFANLVLNCIFACFNFKVDKLFAIGLILFVLCDIFVGLEVGISYEEGAYIIVEESSFLYKLSHPDISIIWTFYLPSQTLIPLSVLYWRIRDKKFNNK
ncbi:MAG: hypothetical protein J6B16_04235 [Clostridia bacterium]|nr:hypothetical protein [Clostridia bacterium]